MDADDTTKARFYQSLSFKVVFGLVVAFIVTISPFFYLQHTRQRAKLIAQRIEFATYQSNIIKASLRHGMITNDRSELQIILDSLGDQGGLVRVWILDKAGAIRASQQPGDVGTQLALTERTCQICHGREPEEHNKTVFFRDDAGRELLRTVSAIENEPQCHACHEPEESINGVIVTDFSIADLNRQALVDLQELLFLSAMAIAVTGLATTLVLRQIVLVRLRDLVETTRQLGRGDLDQRVRPRGRDEIDELAGSLNAMAESLKKRAEELTRAREEIAQRAAQLQRLLARIVRVQEEERGRIAHDMHDGLIQLVAGALFESQAAKERLPSDPQSAVEKLTVVQQLLGQMDEEVRRTIHDLHPPLLDQAGLVPAIKKYARSYEETWGIPCSVQAQGAPARLPSHAEVAIYRIVQEALVNVRTHSEAHYAHVLLEYRPEVLRVMVRDDGRGFDGQKALANPGEQLGLVGMRERAQSLGGHLEVQSAPGQGATILVEVPIELRSEDEEREDQLS